LLIDVFVALFEIVQVLSTLASCNRWSDSARSYGQTSSLSSLTECLKLLPIWCKNWQ